RRADDNGLSTWRWWQDRDRGSRRFYFHPGDADNWRRFTGLLLGSGVTVSDIQSVTIEFYRVFPRDSAFPPSGNVPTRVNSPSDL
ncbi:MAG TPA: hypothetical protein VJ255_13270, partial [Candidatus Acidoferrum sp.]|nr:hypothetical protein [Candidatus Acidoferrum sp.]